MVSFNTFTVIIQEKYLEITGNELNDEKPLNDLYQSYENLIAQGNDDEISFEAVLDTLVHNEPSFN